jgi:phosphoribosyl 1,2-cyclic phosphodiesterase
MWTVNTMRIQCKCNKCNKCEELDFMYDTFNNGTRFYSAYCKLQQIVFDKHIRERQKNIRKFDGLEILIHNCIISHYIRNKYDEIIDAPYWCPIGRGVIV